MREWLRPHIKALAQTMVFLTLLGMAWLWGAVPGWLTLLAVVLFLAWII